MRRLFNFWLFAVVILAFVITSATSFVVITVTKHNEALADMKSEVEYIEEQIRTYDARDMTLENLLELQGTTMMEILQKDENGAAASYLAELMDLKVLEGYSPELSCGSSTRSWTAPSAARRAASSTQSPSASLACTCSSPPCTSSPSDAIR